jgi:hypothetical protein
MNLLLNILATISIIFGIGLLFSTHKGTFIAAVISIGAGVVAYDQKTLIPIVVGFVLLWVLRLVGVEQRE